MAEEWGQKNDAIDRPSRLEQGSSISMLSVVDLCKTEFYALKYSVASILLPLQPNESTSQFMPITREKLRAHLNRESRRRLATQYVGKSKRLSADILASYRELRHVTVSLENHLHGFS